MTIKTVKSNKSKASKKRIGLALMASVSFGALMAVTEPLKAQTLDIDSPENYVIIDSTYDEVNVQTKVGPGDANTEANSNESIALYLADTAEVGGLDASSPHGWEGAITNSETVGFITAAQTGTTSWAEFATAIAVENRSEDAPLFENNAMISATAHAHGEAVGRARAAGVLHEPTADVGADGSGDLLSVVENTGEIKVMGTAHAGGPGEVNLFDDIYGPVAYGEVVGVAQWLDGNGKAIQAGQAVLINENKISAELDLEAIGNNSESIGQGAVAGASAPFAPVGTAVGVDQWVDDVNYADAYVANSAVIEAKTTSFASANLGEFNSFAGAVSFGAALGVEQDVTGAFTADALTENTSRIEATSTSTARVEYSTNNQDISAGINGLALSDAVAEGIGQYAEAGDGASARVNNGYIDIGNDEYILGAGSIVADATANVRILGSVAPGEPGGGLFQGAIGTASADGVIQTVVAGDIGAGDGEAVVYNEIGSLIKANSLANVTVDNQDRGFFIDVAAGYADATGIDQYVSSDDEGEAEVENYGTIEAFATSRVGVQPNLDPEYRFFSGIGDYPLAVRADADATGVYQDVMASNRADLLVENFSSDSIKAVSVATAYGVGLVSSDARSSGVTQFGDSLEGTTIATITNGDNSEYAEADGTITSTAFAKSLALGEAWAVAGADGVYQEIYGDNSGEAFVTNDAGSVISARATATATNYDRWFTDDAAYAEAFGAGVNQNVYSEYDAYAQVTNEGSISAFGSAIAKSLDPNSVNLGPDAAAYADINVVNQDVGASGVGEAFGIVENTNFNSITGEVNSTATSYIWSVAQAHIDGVDQDIKNAGEAVGVVLNGYVMDGEGDFVSAEPGLIDVKANAYSNSMGKGNYEYLSDTVGAYALANADAVDQRIDTQSNGAYGEALVMNSAGSEIRASAYGEAYASEYLSFAWGEAVASATGVQQVVNTNSSYTDQDSSALVYNDGLIDAGSKANAYASQYAVADAQSRGVWQDVGGKDGGNNNSYAYVENNSPFSIHGEANAYASAFLNAQAYSDAKGIMQTLDGGSSGNNTTSEAVVQNGIYGETGGLITAYSEAYAEAAGPYELGYAALADANSDGVRQNLDSNNYASARVTNEEYSEIQAISDARVKATDPGDDFDFIQSGNFAAYATADGVDQRSDAKEPNATAETLVENYGHIEGLAYAYATGQADDTFDGFVMAHASADGVQQEFDGDGYGNNTTGENKVVNTSLMSIQGEAEAYAYGEGQRGEANAYATGVDQYGEDSDYSTQIVENEGLISGKAYAYASSSATNFEPSWGEAYAEARGVWQENEASNWPDQGIDASAKVENAAGAIITAQATAEADSANSFADAEARAFGVYQDVEDSQDGTVDLENHSLIAAYAKATADGDIDEGFSATARAVGGYQRLDDISAPVTASAYFNNTAGNAQVSILDDTWGKVSEGFDQGLRAEALAIGENGNGAAAVAFGHRIESDDGTPGNFKVMGSNSGDISGLATASSTSYAYVRAYGLDIHTQYEGGSPTGVGEYVENTGYIGAKGVAYGGQVFIEAVGVHVESDQNNLKLFNAGQIQALAQVGESTGDFFPGNTGGPNATAILFTDEDEGPGNGYPEIINAGGSLWAGILDQGELSRGNAINTLNSSDSAKITLAGAGFVEKYLGYDGENDKYGMGSGEDGYVSGNIIIKSGDTIDVVQGTTWLDGEVNPDLHSASGEMNIFDNGKLVLQQSMFPNADASTVRVDRFNLASDGRLGLELTPDYGSGDYGKVYAQTQADLNGTIVAIYEASGMYEDDFTYEDVVTASANPIDTTGLQIEDNSALLETTYSQDGDFDVDLDVKRIGFGAVAGLSKTQSNLGGAIESAYGKSGGTDNWNDLVANLFTLNEDDYSLFLNQLGGAEYAQMLKSVLGANRGLNRVIYERMACDRSAIYENTSTTVNGLKVEPTADLAPVATGCFRPETASLWMRGYGSWNKQDGDQNAPGFKEDQYGILFGMDYAFDEVWFAGIAGGYFNSDLDYNSWGGRRGARGEYDGWQIAGYGGYDNSESYARAILAYGSWDTKVNRDIQFPGGSPIDPSSRPDANTLSFYAEGGHRFVIGDGATIAPFLGLSFARGELNGARESDPFGTGAGLHIHKSRADSFATVLGGRFEGDWTQEGGARIVPFVSVAWEHEFDPVTQKVKMSFLDSPSGETFKSVSSKSSRDSFLLGVGGSWIMNDAMDFGVGYDGRYSSKYTSHSFTGRVGYKF